MFAYLRFRNSYLVINEMSRDIHTDALLIVMNDILSDVIIRVTNRRVAIVLLSLTTNCQHQQQQQQQHNYSHRNTTYSLNGIFCHIFHEQWPICDKKWCTLSGIKLTVV